ncbi:DEAD/DEAH box helicase family protein [Undibacterium sp. LX40W]|uniref:DEAD/DEAH box helicase family protein n=1 Tax=Undibacterium nitidum TaxID=2762298 RepID=A0A923HLS6_9BURK|nr:MULTISPECIES: DEAD/DEAH box helicase family protein [Undibacterium]MBC3879968.1 DEAD/DEAH box helicase family protein [Undibacterium nitidum]MBC3891296.1 DEAD/DEAH box helicase family protein [Undibacterium sp. LX40W]
MKLRTWQSECINSAWHKFATKEKHFLCLATPGAGKTVMASTLANRLFLENKIDLVLCFSPSVTVASNFELSLSAITNLRMDGLLGSKGRSLTYQGMLHLDESFWRLFDTNRIFVIFDEIHHCAGDGPDNTNAWGQKIIENIQGRAAYTLALTGTPWRSDQVPIVLARYCQDNRIKCDYVYGLPQAVADNVCRTPQITLIDNDNVTVRRNSENFNYSSFEQLLKDSKCTYQQLIENEELIVYLVGKSSDKLNAIRKRIPNAGGLIVAATIEHANKIVKILEEKFNEQAYIVTYRVDDPQQIINEFKHNSEKWIVAVGMISEGTDIPRLRVCCHLTRVKTELHFRQVLGRILRSNGETESDAFLYMPAEPDLVAYATRVAQEIPEGLTVKFDNMYKSRAEVIQKLDLEKAKEFKSEITLNMGPPYHKTPHFSPNAHLNQGRSSLADTYEASVNIFGKFKQELIAMRLGFSLR